MKFITQSIRLSEYNLIQADMINLIGHAVESVYDKIQFSPEKSAAVVKSCINRGHESVLEHAVITVFIVTDIATYKALTRHRHHSFTIQSTIYSKQKELVFIDKDPSLAKEHLYMDIERIYLLLLKEHGVMEARDILPQSFASKVTMTGNIRAWRTFFRIRRDKADSPKMNELVGLLFCEFARQYPFFFGDCTSLSTHEQIVSA